MPPYGKTDYTANSDVPLYGITTDDTAKNDGPPCGTTTGNTADNNEPPCGITGETAENYGPPCGTTNDDKVDNNKPPCGLTDDTADNDEPPFGTTNDDTAYIERTIGNEMAETRTSHRVNDIKKNLDDGYAPNSDSTAETPMESLSLTRDDKFADPQNANTTLLSDIHQTADLPRYLQNTTQETVRFVSEPTTEHAPSVRSCSESTLGRSVTIGGEGSDSDNSITITITNSGGHIAELVEMYDGIREWRKDVVRETQERVERHSTADSSQTCLDDSASSLPEDNNPECLQLTRPSNSVDDMLAAYDDWSSLNTWLLSVGEEPAGTSSYESVDVYSGDVDKRRGVGGLRQDCDETVETNRSATTDFRQRFHLLPSPSECDDTRSSVQLPSSSQSSDANTRCYVRDVGKRISSSGVQLQCSRLTTPGDTFCQDINVDKSASTDKMLGLSTSKDEKNPPLLESDVPSSVICGDLPTDEANNRRGTADVDLKASICGRAGWLGSDVASVVADTPGECQTDAVFLSDIDVAFEATQIAGRDVSASISTVDTCDRNTDTDIDDGNTNRNNSEMGMFKNNDNSPSYETTTKSHQTPMIVITKNSSQMSDTAAATGDTDRTALEVTSYRKEKKTEDTKKDKTVKAKTSQKATEQNVGHIDAKSNQGESAQRSNTGLYR